MLPIDFEAEEIDIELLRFGFVENSEYGCCFSKCHTGDPPYREIGWDIASALGYESIYHRVFTRATVLRANDDGAKPFDNQRT